MTIFRKELHEIAVPSRRLGRHVAQDPKSKNFPAPESATIFSVNHAIPTDLPLDQGNLGSCTGNAMTGMLVTEPFITNTLRVSGGRLLNEDDAVHLYGQATRLDHYKGVYPPNDTGSSGLAVCKAAQKDGYLNGYAWCFGLEHAVRTLVLQPCIAGTEWLSGMDSPDANGVVHVTGNVRGGHEYLLCELVIANEHGGNIPQLLADPANLIGAENSWGPAFAKGGRFYIPIPEFGQLLKSHGDVKTGVV